MHDHASAPSFRELTDDELTAAVGGCDGGCGGGGCESGGCTGGCCVCTCCLCCCWERPVLEVPPPLP